MKKIFPLTFFLLLANLSSCKNAPVPQTLTEENDPDMIVMNGVGDNRSTSVLGMKPLTFEELTQCAKNTIKLEEFSRNLKNEGLFIENHKSELKRKEDDINAERLTIDTKNSKKVDAFNSKLNNLRNEFEKLDKQIDEYNNKNILINNQVGEFNVNCANRLVRRSDMVKLPSELLSAITMHTSQSSVPVEDNSSEDRLNHNAIHLPVKTQHIKQ